MGAGLAWLGALGFWLIEASYITQISRLYRVKEAEEFNLLFPLLNLLGRLCAITYSIANHEKVMIFGFLLGIILRIVLLSQVIYYRYTLRMRRRLQEDVVSI